MSPTSTRAARVLVPAYVGGAALAAVLAACGGSGGGKQPTTAASPTLVDGVQVFHVSGTPTLTFTPNELDARPGEIKVDFSVEPQSPVHDFIVPSIPGAKTAPITAGTTVSTTFRIDKAGTYQFICAFHPNMQGILKVG
jgi:plastocyanin